MKLNTKPATRRQVLKAALCAPALLSACTSKNEKNELMVFAAASLSESLESCAEAFKKVQAELSISFNFDSSGSLAKQIAEGAVADLFISAGQKQMQELLDTEQVIASTKVDLLANKLCLCSANLDKSRISSFDDFVRQMNAGELLISMGGADVPAGQYASKLLAFLGLDEKALQAAGKISYATNVKEVAAQITEKSVGCGFIYTSDAKVEKLEPLLVADENMTGPIHYPAALCAKGEQQERVQAFFDFLKSAEARDIFERFGFAVLD